MRKNLEVAGAVLVAVVMIVLLFKVFGGPELVSKAEFQGFQSKVFDGFTAQSSRISEVERAVKAIPDMAKDTAAIRDDIKDVKSDRKTDKAVQEVVDKWDAEKLDAIKAKQSEFEKSLTEIKTKAQPCPAPLPYPWTPSAQNEVGFLVQYAGNYNFIFTPTITSFYLDGQVITSNQTVYLSAGWHKYWSDCLVMVTITRY